MLSRPTAAIERSPALPSSRPPQPWRWLAAGIAGLAMGCAPAPLSAFPLAWLALAPLWWLVVRATHWRGALALGCIWGLGYHGLALAWITGVHPMMWLGVPWLASVAIALFCWLAITFWGAALSALWALLFWRLSRSPSPTVKPNAPQPLALPWHGCRLLLGVSLWCAGEALWSAGPLWWTSLSYTQSPNNLWLLHLGQLSGPTAITAVLVAVNGALAEAGLAGQRRQRDCGIAARPAVLWLAIAAGLLASAHALGAGLYFQPEPSGTPLRVGIIQGNIPNDIKLNAAGWRRAIAGYTRGYAQLADQGVEAVLTPETALPFFWEQQKARSSLYAAIRDRGIPAWIGAYGEQGASYTNSLFSVAADGTTVSRYDKVKLVPLGEYIPLASVLGKLIDRLSPLEAHLAAGASGQVFETPFGRAIAGICYESAFSRHFRQQVAAGGEFILTASNNAHYSAAMPAQHHAQDVMRAIESDRWAARATNTGYSAFVSPHGQTLWISGINEYALHAETIYRRQTRTLYARWGDWLLWLLLALSAVLAGWVGRAR